MSQTDRPDEHTLVVNGQRLPYDPTWFDPAVQRAAEAISAQLDNGYRGHWCAEWQAADGRCERCREIARAALTAALEEEGAAEKKRKKEIT